jgi:hypothetical protein
MTESVNIQELLDWYENEVRYYCSLEYESAPSGEYKAYNHNIITQEAIVNTMSSMMDLLGIDYSFIDEKYFTDEEEENVS